MALFSFFRAVMTFGLIAGAMLAVPLAGGQAADTSGAKKPAAAGTDQSFALGQEALKGGDIPAAHDYFAKAAQADPKSADHWNMLAYTERRLGQLDDALAHYAKALELDPKHTGALEYLGEAYLLVGNLPQAVEVYNKLAALCPGGCNESRQLMKSIEQFKAGSQQSSLSTDTW